MLRALGHPVVTCCDMLGAVGSNLKMVKYFIQRLWMLRDVVVVWLGSCTGMRTSSIFNSQNVLARRNSGQHVAPDNVAIVWSELENAGPTML